MDRPPLTPERLSELLTRLDEVMTEASRLRGEINRQLKEQRTVEQPRITATRRRRVKPR